MKSIFIIFLAFLFSCKANADQSKSIVFTAADNYFVKNSQIIDKSLEKVIISQKEFDEIFGTAVHRGEKGIPTAIDFSKEQIIAVMLPVKNTSTEILPLKLVNTKTNEAEFFYEIKPGKKLSYGVRPELLLVEFDKLLDTTL